jgi:iron complex outermembrane recepter protein
MTKVQRLLASICCLFVVSLGHAESMASLPADIAPQPVTSALMAFARETGLQVVFLADIATALQSEGARAGLSTSDALTQLLKGTGLRFESINERTVGIYAVSRAPSPAPSTPPSPPPVSHDDTSTITIGEVLVTARKREEQASSVPMSMVVWTQDAMEASGIKSITELGALTPGIEFDVNTGIGDFFTNIIIRGVAPAHDTTTGVFLDDTRLPTVRGDTYLRSFPFTFDLNRVEVLRGPQGTLLGEGTQGGAVRFIMNQPSLTTFSALARTEFAATESGDPSYELGAASGGPIVPDVFGFRVSGWYRSDGGYVDRVDPFTGVTVDENANRSTAQSFRGALLWAPTDSLRVTPSLAYQSVDIRDPGSFYTDLSNPAAGDLKSGSLFQRPYHDSYYTTSLKLVANLGAADLSAVATYFDRAVSATLYAGPEDPVDYADAVKLLAELKQRVFSQEVRLASTDPNAALGWVAGIWYSGERDRLSSHADALQAREDTATDRTQLAGFGQVSLRMTQHLTASAGLRIERANSDSVTEATPPSRAEVATTSTAPRFDLSYQTGKDNLFYLSVAEGYGSGGTAATVLNGCESPERYGPDNIWSYEIGTKAAFLDGRTQFEASIFHLSWNNALSECGDNSIGGVVATHQASDGFDFAARALLTEQLRAGLNIAYTDAHYTKTAKLGDVVVVHKGDAIDGPINVISPWNITGSIEYSLHNDTVHVRAEDVFHSHNPGPYHGDDPASLYYFPGFRTDATTNVINLRADVSWPSLELALFINNATDTQEPLARVSRFSSQAAPYIATTFRPRTLGLTATWRF